jgi:hypothetical protein
MTPERPSMPIERPPTVDDLSKETLSDQQRNDLADPAKQADYLRAYAQQLGRRACPGCGDDGIPF